MGKMRLDKYLADMGLGTRSEVKKLLKGGQVAVNGGTVTKPVSYTHLTLPTN